MELDQHEGSYLATCKHYRAVLNTPSIQADPEERQAAARAVVLYIILAPHENEQVRDDFFISKVNATVFRAGMIECQI